MAMGTGAKIALGCGCLLLAGLVAGVGACGVLGYWVKGKTEGVVSDIESFSRQAAAVTDEIDRWEKQANANAYAAPADGVIEEARLLKFLETRRRIAEVYEARRPDLRALEEKSQKPQDKLSPSDLWSAGGKMAEVYGALRLAQVKALAEVGMSEAEYRDIQVAVYKSAWASASERETGQMPAEALEQTMEQAGREMSEALRQGVGEAQRQQLPGAGQLSPEEAARLGAELAEAGKLAKALEVPRENVELFRKHQADIEKYAMHGLAILGL